MGGCWLNVLPIFCSVKELLRISILVLSLVSISGLANADIGLTHQLKQQRTDVLAQVAELRADSIAHHQEIDSLQNLVIDLDAKIMSSYDETVDRLAARNRDFGTNAKTIVYVALVAIGMAFFLIILIGIARKRIINSGNTGLFDVFRQLTSDFVSSVSHENITTKKLLRVNVVVVLGLILMSISVLAFLLRTL